MSFDIVVECVNCGKQVLIDGPEDICYWCHKNASKEEVIMVMAERAVPPRPNRRANHPAYYEENKEAILADFTALKLLDFLKKWKISTFTWQKLKRKWEIKSKQTGRPNTRPGNLNATAKHSTGDVDVSLTEHERYLILLGYQQAVREFLRANKS